MNSKEIYVMGLSKSVFVSILLTNKVYHVVELLRWVFLLKEEGYWSGLN